MKQRETVRHIMTDELRTLSLHDGNLMNAKTIMEENHFRHLPITSGDKLVGMISLTDIHRISFGGNYGQAEQVDTSIFDTMTIQQVMKNNPSTINIQTTIKEAAEQLTKEEFHALPVVDDSGKLEGIVTTTDLINYLLEQY
jgi:CBS domain-containing protein